MKISREDFFQTAVNILFRERSQGSCSYRESIEKAQKELKISREHLRHLCSEGVTEIEI